MKTELKLNGAGHVELWHDGKMIGQVAGSEGPGVQVISTHPLLPKWHADETMKCVEVRIASEGPVREVEFPPKRG